MRSSSSTMKGGDAVNTIGLIFNIVVQVGLGVLVIYLVYLVSLAVMKQDSIISESGGRMQNSPEESTLILDGYASSSRLHNHRYNTVNPYVSNYAAITRSMNRVGGAQFTYSFWLRVSNVATNDPRVAGKDILLRGDNREYTYQKSQYNYTQNPEELEVTERTTDKVIKCPRIRFGDDVTDIVVEFNTHDDINHRVSLASIEQRNDPTIRHNLMSLMQNKWVMLTFSFQDNVPVNDFENGIVLQVFVNDVLYHTHRVSSALKNNYGDLYLFPSDEEVKNCTIGNLKYYNYAVGVKEVKDLYKKGFPKKLAALAGTSENVGAPLYLSEYNKLDLHNL